MQYPSIKVIFIIFLFFITACSDSKRAPSENLSSFNLEYSHRIPAGENSWVSGNTEKGIIKNEGIANWSESDNKITSYFRVNGTGELQLGLRIRVPNGSSKLKVSVAGESKIIKVDNSEFIDLGLGTFNIEAPGYQSMEIIPIEKTGKEYAEIAEILVGGPAAAKELNYVEDNFHFGRRGPSVHLRYQYPEEKEVLYFYNEIEVPEGEDVIGSYFMANGFSHGYFGIQVNTETERRVLFSVWSPYDTQDPNEIPEDYRIQLLKKGENVTTGEFGNEGSGGQSYKVFPWKAGSTYKFLLKGEPAGDNYTDYTAHFFAPEVGEWQLVASFRRPYTDTYLGDLYSFLENFVPSTGDTPRKALYKNQWIYDNQGNWTESTKIQFTADATARAGHRKDFSGGVLNGAFFMQNCGFYDEYTEMDSWFEREATGTPPKIDFESLE